MTINEKLQQICLDNDVDTALELIQAGVDIHYCNEAGEMASYV